MDAVTLGMAKSALRGNEGPLHRMPIARGSRRTYYAIDDCGGTLYVDTEAGGWERVGPRGELCAVSLGSTSYTTSTSHTSIYGAFLEIETDDKPRQVDVSIEALVQVGNPAADGAWTTGSRLAGIRVMENGVNILDVSTVQQPPASAIANGTSHRTVRRTLAPNTLYQYQAYITSQSASPVVNVRTQSLYMKVVEL